MSFNIACWLVLGLTLLITVAVLSVAGKSDSLSNQRPIYIAPGLLTTAGWLLVILAVASIALIFSYLVFNHDWSKGLPTARKQPLLFGLTITSAVPWVIARLAWFEAEVVRMNAADPDHGKRFMAAFTKAKAEHEAMMERDRLARENERKSRGRGPEPKPYDIDRGSET